MPLPQPCQIGIDIGAAEIVENDHFLALGEIAVGNVGADKARSPDHQQGLLAPQSGRRGELGDIAGLLDPAIHQQPGQQLGVT